MTLPTILSNEQLFKLAKRYIDNGDIKGFNNNFMLMTPQMLAQIAVSESEIIEEKAKQELIAAVREEIGKMKEHCVSCDNNPDLFPGEENCNYQHNLVIDNILSLPILQNKTEGEE